MKHRTFKLSVLGIFLAATGWSLTTQAADYKGISYSIEPIIGYDFQRKDNPTRSKMVFTYGARVIAGYKILSAEGEYTTGKSDELFSDTGTRIEEKVEKIRVGLRSTYEMGSFLDWYLRGGAEAQKKHTTLTLASVVTESDSPSKIYPYIGTGVSLNLASQFALNASVTATLKDLNDMKQNEYSTTLGVRINFNAR